MAKDFTGYMKKYNAAEEQKPEVKEVAATPTQAPDPTPTQEEAPEVKIYSPIERVAHSTDKGKKEASFTIKTTQEFLDIVRALAYVKNTNSKDIIVTAINDYCKKNKADLEAALEMIDKYLKREG